MFNLPSDQLDQSTLEIALETIQSLVQSLKNKEMDLERTRELIVKKDQLYNSIAADNQELRKQLADCKELREQLADCKEKNRQVVDNFIAACNKNSKAVNEFLAERNYKELWKASCEAAEKEVKNRVIENARLKLRVEELERELAGYWPGKKYE